MPPYQGFVGGSYVAQSPVADGEQLMNAYLEPLGVQSGRSRLAMYPIPGVEELDEVASSPGRGGHIVLVHEGVEREFAVIGTKFGEIGATGAFTSIGTVAVDANPATASYNGDGGGQVFVTSGNNGYIYDLNTSTFTQERTGETTMGAHLDGYFIALDAATGTIFLSDLLDGTTWDPTQFAQRSIAADPWISMVVHDRLIRLFGPATGESWYNAGTFPFPFAPHPSGLIPYGTAAPFSSVVVAGSVMWLAATKDGQGEVAKMSGLRPDIVSTFPLQVRLSELGTLADGVGDTYQDLGHSFYVLTFPTANATVCYDATSTLGLPDAMRWADRGTWISESNRYDAWRPLFHAFAFGEHRMLDRASGGIYRMSADLYTDVDGRPIRGFRRAPAIWAKERALTIGELELELEPGLGLSSGQGNDPQVALRYSTNAGKTYGNELSRSAGAIGQYSTRVYWNRLGCIKKGQGWVPELVWSDPVPWRITGARVKVA